MSYFIGYSSALEFWRSNYAPSRPKLSRARPILNSTLNKTEINAFDFPSIGIVTFPIHFIVAHPRCRTKSKLAICHVVGNLAARSFVRIEDDVYVSSLEFYFVQMAHMVPFIELILLGFELCGKYVLDKTDPQGFRNRIPLTSVASLRRYIERAGSMRGINAAKRALGYIADNSASPMETILTMLFCLPCSLGGYGIAYPQLNGKINITAPKIPSRKDKYFVCDMLWRSHQLAVEYDSTLCHAGEDRMDHDSKRRTDLNNAGLAVVTVSAGQVFDARALDKVASVLTQRLGKEAKSKKYNLLTRRYELRTILFKDIVTYRSAQKTSMETSDEQPESAPS